MMFRWHIHMICSICDAAGSEQICLIAALFGECELAVVFLPQKLQLVVREDALVRQVSIASKCIDLVLWDRGFHVYGYGYGYGYGGEPRWPSFSASFRGIGFELL